MHPAKYLRNIINKMGAYIVRLLYDFPTGALRERCAQSGIVHTKLYDGSIEYFWQHGAGKF